MNQLFWNAYKRLEREVLALSESIHFDDSQIGVYSSKIGDLLVRTVIEIESLSKVLYFANGGATPNNRDYVYFDTDCLDLLENKWKIGKKVILISSPYFYFEKETNKILTPLYKASKRGNKSSEWMRAYQAVKHDRVNNLRKGNIKNLLNALGALFVLNVYYRDAKFENVNDKEASNIDWGMGSELFSVKISHGTDGVSIDKTYEPKSDYYESIYLVKHTDKTAQIVVDLIHQLNEEASRATSVAITEILNDKVKTGELKPEQDLAQISSIVKELYDETSSAAYNNAANNNARKIADAFNELRFEAVLNKHQF